MALQDAFVVFRPARLVCELYGDSWYVRVKDGTTLKLEEFEWLKEHMSGHNDLEKEDTS